MVEYEESLHFLFDLDHHETYDFRIQDDQSIRTLYFLRLFIFNLITQLGVVGGRDLPADPSDLKRNEAARWIRHTLGVVGGRDLPADPSEDDFRIALRSGILLCNVLNKVKPGAVPKVCLTICICFFFNFTICFFFI